MPNAHDLTPILADSAKNAIDQRCGTHGNLTPDRHFQVVLRWLFPIVGGDVYLAGDAVVYEPQETNGDEEEERVAEDFEDVI